jgi:hypothetical protein
MRIFAIIAAAVVFILGPGYYLVGYNVVSPLEKAAKEAALRPNIIESDLYETGTVTKDERASIAKTCRAAFAPGKALDEVISNIAQHRAKAAPFCECVVEKATDMPIYDRSVMVAELQNHGINLNKLKRGLSAIVVSTQSASSRHHQASKRISESYAGCMSDNELE